MRQSIPKEIGKMPLCGRNFPPVQRRQEDSGRQGNGENGPKKRA